LNGRALKALIDRQHGRFSSAVRYSRHVRGGSATAPGKTFTTFEQSRCRRFLNRKLEHSGELHSKAEIARA
jgi:hypothetical protein